MFQCLGIFYTLCQVMLHFSYILFHTLFQYAPARGLATVPHPFFTFPARAYMYSLLLIMVNRCLLILVCIVQEFIAFYRHKGLSVNHVVNGNVMISLVPSIGLSSWCLVLFIRSGDIEQNPGSANIISGFLLDTRSVKSINYLIIS